MKNIYSLFFVLINFVFAQIVTAQTQPQAYAWSGGTGIFVSPGPEFIGSGKAVKKFLIERKEITNENWSFVDSLTAPENFEEFYSRIQKFSDIFSAFDTPSEEELGAVFSAAREYGTLDSLKFWGAMPAVRTALGVMYFDGTAEKNKTYHYRFIKIRNDNSEGESIQTNNISFPQKAELGKPRLTEKFGNENIVYCKWLMLGEKTPANLQVFKRENKNGIFARADAIIGIAGKEDSVFVFVQDSSVYSNMVYEYYIQPYDLYFNAGAISDTAVIGAYTFYGIAAPQNFAVNDADSVYGIMLSWDPSVNPLTRSVQIYRSVNFDSGFDLLAEVPAAEKTFLDQSVEPMRKYFYYLILKGPLDEVSSKSVRAFGFAMDKTPPKPPRGFSLKPVPSGVELNWENDDPFIKGFYVYRNDGVNDSLRLISSLLYSPDSIFSYTDSAKGLSGRHNYLYAVKAENTSHIQGLFSDTLSVRPGIKSDPPAPFNLIASAGSGTVNLYWEDMRTFDDFLNGYYLLRREKKSGGQTFTDYKTIGDTLLPENNNHFTDAEIEPETEYEYAVQSVDIFGNKSAMSKPASARLAVPAPPSPAGLFVSSNSGKIVMEWSPLDETDITEYKIYRYQRGTEAISLGSVKFGEGETFTDSNIKKNELYFYFVTAVNSLGKESRPSEEIGVRAE